MRASHACGDDRHATGHIPKSDEIFLTGTAAEVTPVGEIDDHDLQVGPVTRTLMEDDAATERALSPR